MTFRSGKTAIITGASSGIGAELARVMAAHGHDLVLTARRADALRDLERRLVARHQVSCEIVAADLAEPGAAKRVAEAAPEADYLVNNAGFGTYGEFAKTDLRADLDMIRVNVSALTELTKLLLPGMIERGAGRILNVASTAAFFSGPLMAAYYATKAYVLHFSEALAVELKGKGVTVTALCPGPTASDFQDRAGMGASGLVRGRTLATAASVAEAGYRAMMRGRRVAVPGLGNRLLILAARFLPRGWTTSIVGSIQKERR